MENEIDSIILRYGKTQRDNLIPILQEIQATRGFIPEEAIIKIAVSLNLPTSKIYGVATFYDQFRFVPRGKINIMLCDGTHCHVKGGTRLLNKIERYLQIRSGETSRDGTFQLSDLPCMGACSNAPVISINGTLYEKMTFESFKTVIGSLIS